MYRLSQIYHTTFPIILMNNLIKYILAGAVALGIVLYASNCYQTRKSNTDAVLAERITNLEKKDSTTMHNVNILGNQVESTTKAAVVYLDRWHTTTQKVYVPGRVDSVYKDSVFAALPDSTKVKVLTALGNVTAAKCTEALTTCKQFKDSAYSAFVNKDSLINLWHDRYDNKPSRRCGIGFAAGYGGVLTTTGPIALSNGPSITVGYACRL